MSYSDACESLYQLALDTPLITRPRYTRIGIYLVNVMVTDWRIRQGSKPENYHDSYRDKKGILIDHICELTDSEWNTVQTTLLDRIKEHTDLDPDWDALRIGWLRELDTLRAFQ